MSATTTQTLIAASAARTDIVQSESVKDVAQATINSPQLAALVTLVIGPLIRQYGHSALVGAIGPILILLASGFGLTMPQDISEALSVLLFVGGSYGWQALSIWLGRRKAMVAVTGSPVQPTTGPAP